jgi:hypothetical protein
MGLQIGFTCRRKTERAFFRFFRFVESKVLSSEYNTQINYREKRAVARRHTFVLLKVCPSALYGVKISWMRIAAPINQ